MNKRAILVVSFGTSYPETRELTIGAIETAINEAFSQYKVFRAFTSQIIIDKLKSRDHISIDNVTEAMDRLRQQGFREVVIQPTHVMPGEEYDDMMSQVRPFESQFESILYGRPLLGNEGDYKRLVELLLAITKDKMDKHTAMVFMGHGTTHRANITYHKLGEMFHKAGHSRYFVGTVEAEPDIEAGLEAVKGMSVKKVVLQPLMIVAGDHANEDMAGEEEDSWKSRFTARGYEVECVVRGLGEYSQIQKIFIDHVGDALINKI